MKGILLVVFRNFELEQNERFFQMALLDRLGLPKFRFTKEYQKNGIALPFAIRNLSVEGEGGGSLLVCSNLLMCIFTFELLSESSTCQVCVIM